MIAATRVALTTGLSWFLAGNLLGLLIGLGVVSYAWRPAHAHMNLLGFVAMLIYGVAYHALPRFRGVPFVRPRLALVQVLLANVALLAMVLSWGMSLSWPYFATGGILQLCASVIFVGLMLEVLWRRPPFR